MTVDEAMLRATDNAKVWAEAFCEQFDGCHIVNYDNDSGVDIGTMVGWFVNAMETAKMLQTGRFEQVG